jgi:UDP-N-acetylmuramoyl-L-alanyl-D-glutamate--2,6-diaminopimelate ligase
MNNEEVTKLLKPYLISCSANLETKISGATTNLQLAKTEDICFYNLNSDKKSLEIFKERLDTSATRNIVTTSNVVIEDSNIWVVEKEKYLSCQRAIANKLYPNENKIKLVGITGTNGKTTCSYLAMQLATECGVSSLSIGTIGVRSVKGIIEKDLLSTTPSYLELRKLIHKFQSDYKAIFIEISSHALAQERLFDIELDFAGWTSFSQDHLDYHKDLEDYFNSKAKILNNTKSKSLLVPRSEESLIKKLSEKKVNIEKIESIYNDDLSVGFKASYNQSNLGLAKALVSKIISREVSQLELSKIKLPDGRFEPIEYKDSIVIVDYAHTPDALENICHTIKKDFKSFSLIVVFGCGGDRDRGKRPLMGKAVSKYADKIIVTSDNPRSEDKMQIINDAIKGISKDYLIEVDRKKALELALDNIEGKSAVLIAGKGHEDYQEIEGVKHNFSDSEIIKELIKGR